MQEKKPQLIIVGMPGPEHAASIAKLQETNEVIFVPEIGNVSDPIFNSAPPQEKMINIKDMGYFQEMDDLLYDHLTKKERNAVIVPVRTEPKYQRNQSCPCGSGKKYKHCCGKNN